VSTAPSATLLRTLCSAPDTDETSRVLVGRDATGAVIRYQVTPTRRFADLGGLYFDDNRRFLGQGVALVRLDDSKEAREARARQERLTGGVLFVDLASCADQRGSRAP